MFPMIFFLSGSEKLDLDHNVSARGRSLHLPSTTFVSYYHDYSKYCNGMRIKWCQSNEPRAPHMYTHHGSNSWMILSKRITANNRLENPATHANANIAKVKSVETPAEELNELFTAAPAFFAMLRVVYDAKAARAIDLNTEYHEYRSKINGKF